MYATNTAWLLDQLTTYTGRPVTVDDVDPLNWALAELGRACPAPQLLDTIHWLHGYTRRIAAWWEERLRSPADAHAAGAAAAARHASGPIPSIR